MEGKTKERYVHEVFQSIAPKYDRMNDIISFRRHKAWRAFAMRRMNVRPGSSAVDLCCGTCDWTIALARAGAARVVGLDFSEAMLEIGRRKVEQAGLAGRIELHHGNAMSLPYGDNAFDYATIGFGLRNVPDLRQVLREMTRVVKPGGLVVSLDVSKPTWQPFKAVYDLYFQHVLPFLGNIFARRYEQYKWLPESLSRFPGRLELADIFREVGLADVEAYPLTGGVAALHIGVKRGETA